MNLDNLCDDINKMNLDYDYNYYDYDPANNKQFCIEIIKKNDVIEMKKTCSYILTNYNIDMTDNIKYLCEIVILSHNEQKCIFHFKLLFDTLLKICDQDLFPSIIG